MFVSAIRPAFRPLNLCGLGLNEPLRLAARAHPPRPDGLFSGSRVSTALSALALQSALAEHFEAARPRPREWAEVEPRVVVLLPCHNEAACIGAVVEGFRQALPHARIVVFDNASTDATSDLARQAGADVRFEARKGKGNVVRRMFADIDADVYLMADGDGTYDASAAPALVRLITEGGHDMAVGARKNIVLDAHRKGHAAGNKLFNGLYARFFGAEFGDVFSGYRAFSRRFVKSFPALSTGFEIETEISVHATQLKLSTVELVLPYGKRQDGSASKLRTFRDGARILRTFLYLLKETRPLAFFGLPALMTALISAALALPLLVTFVETGLVPRFPTAILCTGLFLLAALLGVCGVILDSVAQGRAEQKRMLFLALSTAR